MLGWNAVSRSQRQAERNRADGHAPGADPADRHWAPDRRQLRGQLDLVRELLASSPWYG